MNLVYVHHPVCIPCVVYKRAKAHLPFTFSHLCDAQTFYKILPSDLTLHTLLQYRSQDVLRAYMKHVVLVLVSGDTAKCLTVSQSYKDATVFLYYKSQYNQTCDPRLHECCEIHEDYISWKCNSTLTYYQDGYFCVSFLLVFYFFYFL